MLLKHRRGRGRDGLLPGFSTLYRVDAIEAIYGGYNPQVENGVSVPSIGSMLLKQTTDADTMDARRRFSTLYRVDAIEAATPAVRGRRLPPSFSTLYRVDAIEAAG